MTLPPTQAFVSHARDAVLFAIWHELNVCHVELGWGASGVRRWLCVVPLMVPRVIIISMGLPTSLHGSHGSHRGHRHVIVVHKHEHT